MSRGITGRRRTRQQKAAWFRAVIDRAFHGIPHGRESLPFIDQDGPLAIESELRVGGDNRSLGRDVEAANGGREPRGSGRLSHPLGPLQGESGNTAEEFGEFVVQNPRNVMIFLHKGLL